MSWSLAAMALAGLFGGAAAFGTEHFSIEQSVGFGASEALGAQAARGSALFTATWHITAPAGDSRTGLGPFYNAASCNDCHNGGLHGIGPQGDGPAPTSLVIRLSANSRDESAGDPIYGRVFSTHSIPGVRTEGSIRIGYRPITGYYYPFGGAWQMREPHYRLVDLAHGPLKKATIVRPRIAPSLYGVGLLEQIPAESLLAGTAQPSGRLAYRNYHGKSQLGRFGWQNGAVSLRDQTTRALVDEMGVTSSDQPEEDCTPAELDCHPSSASLPEADDGMVADIATYLQSLGMPPSGQPPADFRGRDTFQALGCAQCHRPQWNVRIGGKDQPITPYTDLRLHDLGLEMADETISGKRVTTEWRTAPLWGIALRLQTEQTPTFMHDGRARSLEEAILWHFGEGRHARYGFMSLGPNARKQLLQWLQSL